MDEVQADLERWHLHGDARAGSRAVRRIATEWRERIRVFFSHPAEDVVDDILQEILVRLLTSEGGARPKALAPPGAENPAAWRRKVLRNALVSYTRERIPRERAEEAARHDLTAAAAREVRDRRRTGGPVVLPVPADDPDPADILAIEERDWLAGCRRTVVQALPQINVKRRVAVAMELGLDQTPWVMELARALSDDVESVAARIGSDIPRHRVLYPDGSGRESYRKLVERGLADLRALVGREEP